jgi:hypothetical protein
MGRTVQCSNYGTGKRFYLFVCSFVSFFLSFFRLLFILFIYLFII